MVLLLSGVMAAFGISVSIIIIAVNGGFSGPGPSIFNPPTASNLWVVGGNVRPDTMLNYSLTRIGSHDSPSSSLGSNARSVAALSACPVESTPTAIADLDARRVGGAGQVAACQSPPEVAGW